MVLIERSGRKSLTMESFALSNRQPVLRLGTVIQVATSERRAQAEVVCSPFIDSRAH